MCVKIAFSLFLAAFGVCSVSQDAYSYSTPPSSQSVRYSRSARETPKPQKTADYSASSHGPFSPGTQNWSIGIGQVFLLGKLGNQYENSIGPEFNYTYGVSDLFAFESNFGYHSHSNGAFTLWNLDAGLRTNLMYFDQLVPFVNLGLGFYHPSVTYPNGGGLSGLLFGMQLGSGIDLLISKEVFFGTRITYNNMFDSSKKDSSGTSQILGGSYFSFMIHAGLTF